jgi:hypothetical protein
MKKKKGGSSYYTRDSEIPDDEAKLKEWFNFFHAKVKYPFYGIIMASATDTEVVSLVENHQNEIADISDKECCFVYFRDIASAKRLSPFKYSEHEK